MHFIDDQMGKRRTILKALDHGNGCGRKDQLCTAGATDFTAAWKVKVVFVKHENVTAELKEFSLASICHF